MWVFFVGVFLLSLVFGVRWCYFQFVGVFSVWLGFFLVSIKLIYSQSQNNHNHTLTDIYTVTKDTFQFCDLFFLHFSCPQCLPVHFPLCHLGHLFWMHRSCACPLHFVHHLMLQSLYSLHQQPLGGRTNNSSIQFFPLIFGSFVTRPLHELNRTQTHR